MSYEDLPVFDVEQLGRVLESNDLGVLRGFYELFLSQLNELQHTLASPRQPVATADLHMLAHKFKSSAKAVGAVQLGEQMETLEAICSQREPVGIDAQIEKLQRTVAATCAALSAWLASNAA